MKVDDSAATAADLVWWIELEQRLQELPTASWPRIRQRAAESALALEGRLTEVPAELRAHVRQRAEQAREGVLALAAE